MELFGIDNVRLFFEDTPINFLRSAEKQNIHKTRTVELLKEKMQATLINLFTSIFAGTRLEGAELSFTVIQNINRCPFSHPVYDIKVRCDGTSKEVYKIFDFNLWIDWSEKFKSSGIEKLNFFQNAKIILFFRISLV